MVCSQICYSPISPQNILTCQVIEFICVFKIISSFLTHSINKELTS